MTRPVLTPMCSSRPAAVVGRPSRRSGNDACISRATSNARAASSSCATGAPKNTKILVGTDGSKTAARAVERAVDVARASGATLTIFSAARADKGEQVVVAEAQRHASSGVTIDTKVVDGEPVASLIDAARNGG